MLHSINLLPWREAKRRHHQLRFIWLIVGCVAFTGLIQWSAGSFVDYQQREQHQRLGFLQAHIANLDFKLRQLKEVEQEHGALLTRLRVVEELQAERNKTTQLMNVLPTLIPKGVYVDKIKMNGHQIAMSGISDTTSRLATMLDRLENSAWLNNVEMHSIVHGTERFGQKFQTFNVSFLFQSQDGVAGGELNE